MTFTLPPRRSPTLYEQLVAAGYCPVMPNPNRHAASRSSVSRSVSHGPIDNELRMLDTGSLRACILAAQERGDAREILRLQAAYRNRGAVER
jgi:hypothetical protein